LTKYTYTGEERSLFDYKLHVGTIAWLFHRISGLVLIFYLSLHVWVVHYIAESPEQFNKLMEFLALPIFKLAEVGLMAAILYHAFNGLRIILAEYVWGNANQKVLFWVSFITSTILTLIGAWFLLMGH
jgi:succinate dehydrogenase / fumarate reductase cytochrome b subunit